LHYVRNTRFAIGVHILTALAFRDGKAVPSEDLAASVRTNAAFIRQVLVQLRRAGFVESRLGKGGGTVLARAAGSIRLDEVYQATASGPTVSLHRTKPNPNCPVGRNIQPLLTSVLGRAESALLKELHRVSLADLVAEIRAA
jgi:Rrf2 family protein